MQSICQSRLSGFFSNKVLHNLQFLVVSRLKSAGIMKNITVMIGENELVINPVLATLCEGSVATDRLADRWCGITNLHGWFEFNLVAR
jgi:hypothetical protein